MSIASWFFNVPETTSQPRTAAFDTRPPPVGYTACPPVGILNSGSVKISQVNAKQSSSQSGGSGWSLWCKCHQDNPRRRCRPCHQGFHPCNSLRDTVCIRPARRLGSSGCPGRVRRCSRTNPSGNSWEGTPGGIARSRADHRVRHLAHAVLARAGPPSHALPSAGAESSSQT